MAPAGRINKRDAADQKCSLAISDRRLSMDGRAECEVTETMRMMASERTDLPDDVQDDAQSSIDERAFRDVMGRFATGVTVVTTAAHDGAPVGVTVNSFSSVSLDPPLVLWSLGLRAPSLPAFRGSGRFAVNILPNTHRHLCEQFARPSADKFSGVAYRRDENGLPLLDGAVAQIICSTWRRYPGGDHEIFVGRVQALRAWDHDPLVFYRGRASTLRPLSESEDDVSS